MTGAPIAPEAGVIVTVGAEWVYIGLNEALRLRAISGTHAVIEIARADRVFPGEPSQREEPPS